MVDKPGRKEDIITAMTTETSNKLAPDTGSLGLPGRVVIAPVDGAFYLEDEMNNRLSRTPLYFVWQSMRSRCNNPCDKAYKNYGARGIKVCDSWNEFTKFCTDMGDRPESMTIERNDNNGNYEPENCRWATRKEQNRNHRRNKKIIWNGEEKCLADWASTVGVCPQTLDYRLKHYPVNVALSFKRSDRKGVLIVEYQGITRTVHEWAEELNIAYGTLWYRLQRYPIDVAFATPVRNSGRKLSHGGKDQGDGSLMEEAIKI